LAASAITVFPLESNSQVVDDAALHCKVFLTCVVFVHFSTAVSPLDQWDGLTVELAGYPLHGIRYG